MHQSSAKSSYFEPDNLLDAIDGGMLTGYYEGASGWSEDRGSDASPWSRKVRTPQGTVPGNAREGAIFRIGPQKTTAPGESLLAA
jgi:hypothetical protein